MSYIEELGVFLAVDDWVTHVGFCVWHGGRGEIDVRESRGEIEKRREGEDRGE